MKFSMAKAFAFQNLKANRLLAVPFVLSSGTMLSLLYIMASLMNNTYVQTRHTSLPMVIGIGLFIVAILTAIFVIYTTNFLLKRRNKEFALYAILGLEKKHIRRVIGIEFAVLFALLAVFGIVGGYIFGKLSFLGLNRLLQDVSGRLMDYPFSSQAALIVILLLAGLYIFAIMRSSVRIYLSSPMQLLQKQYSGEGEPKSRYILLILGIIALGVGYYMALTIQGILSSLLLFFVAALIVMLATYLLYISFSVIFLKWQKKKKSYYTPAKFLSISGLLYRMKSNAVSLASISILSAGVIIALSATGSIYSSIHAAASNLLPRQYRLHSQVLLNETTALQEQENLKKLVLSTVENPSQITEMFSTTSLTTAIIRKGDSFEEYNKDSSSIPNYLMASTLDSYNARMHSNITLAEDEILLCANLDSMVNMKTLKLGEKTFKVIKIPNIVPSNYAVEVYFAVVKDFATLQYISENYPEFNFRTKEFGNAVITAFVDWNAEGIVESDYVQMLKGMCKEKNMEVDIFKESYKTMYELNGGFLFLGVVIALIFLTGTVLISYYKQISEGFEDREKYQTMKKVGLSNELIRKTGASQIVGMFFAPLAVASIHCLVASKIVYQLLGMFAVRSFMQYAQYFLIVISLFFIVYFIIFKLTSKVYYSIVK